MAEVDTSIYNRPAPNPLETVRQVQGIQSGQLGIQRQQLELVNQGYNNLIQTLNSLPADATADQMRQFATEQVKLRRVTPEMASTFIAGIPSNPAQIPAYRQTIAARLASTQEALNWHYGNQPQMYQTPSGIQVGQSSQRTGQIRPTGGLIPNQLPVTQPEVNQDPNSPNYGQPGVRGVVPPVAPQGMTQRPGGFVGEVVQGLPVQSAPIVPTPIPTTREPSSRNGGLPVAPPSVAPPVAPGAGSDMTPDERGIPPAGGFVATGLPPGVAEARQVSTAAGGTHLAEDRNAATAKLQGIIPMRQALQLLPQIATGVGTPTYNQARAALINLGVIQANQNDPTVIYQEVNKLLSRYVGSSPLAQRSDASQALAQSGNPNVATQLNPALTKVAREAVALDRIQAAMPLSYGNRGAEGYAAYRASFPQSVDERAFSIDLLPPEDRSALIAKMRNYRTNGTAAQKREEARFRKSLEMAHDLNLVSMPE